VPIDADPLFCLTISLPKTWLASIVPMQFKSITLLIASAGRSKNDSSSEVVAFFGCHWPH